MGGLLHLVQRGGAGRAAVPPSPLLAVPNVTSPPINGQCTNLNSPREPVECTVRRDLFCLFVCLFVGLGLKFNSKVSLSVNLVPNNAGSAIISDITAEI